MWTRARRLHPAIPAWMTALAIGVTGGVMLLRANARTNCNSSSVISRQLISLAKQDA